jgi:hypothetical protein
MLEATLLLKVRRVLLLANLVIVIGRRLGRHGLHIDVKLDQWTTAIEEIKIKEQC